MNLEKFILGQSPEKSNQQLSETSQNNLSWFFINGFFASASDAISLNYLTLFILALGANNAQIGWMTALASLSATIMLLPGAAITDRWGYRKKLVLFASGGIGRFILLLLAITPFYFGNENAILVAMILKIVADGFGQFSVPAWTSLTADIVPLNIRGRYFSSRNIAMSLSNLVVTFFAGQLITWIGSPAGYQVAMGISFIFGVFSSFSYSRIQEPERRILPAQNNNYTPSSLLALFKKDPRFLIFLVYVIGWNIFVNIAAPFFSVYMVQGLGASAAIVGILSTIANTSSMVGQRLFGSRLEKWGARRMLLISGFLIPVAVFSWLFVSEPWHVAPINIIGALGWSGYGLASFNFLLIIAPREQLVKYSALFQMAVMIAGSIGSSIGSVIVTSYSILTAIVISGVGRIIFMFFFARYVHAPTPTSEPESLKTSVIE